MTKDQKIELLERQLKTALHTMQKAIDIEFMWRLSSQVLDEGIREVKMLELIAEQSRSKKEFSRV